MTTVTVRDLRYKFPEIEARLRRGEVLELRKRRELLGRLIPVPRARPEAPHPDYAAMQQAIFGRRWHGHLLLGSLPLVARWPGFDLRQGRPALLVASPSCLHKMKVAAANIVRTARVDIVEAKTLSPVFRGAVDCLSEVIQAGTPAAQASH